MPIPDSELNQTINRHVLVPAKQTVYDALKTWRTVPDHYEWWWLIIDQSGGRYTAIRFDGLHALLAKPDSGVTMFTRLADLPQRRQNPADWEHPFPGVVTPTIVEQDSVGMARANALRQDSPGRVLIVTNGGVFRGILSGDDRNFAFTDKPLLDMLDEFEAGAAEPPQLSAPGTPPTLSAPDVPPSLSPGSSEPPNA